MACHDVEKASFALIVASYCGAAEDVPVEAEISLIKRAGVGREHFTRLAVAVSQKIIPCILFN